MQTSDRHKYFDYLHHIHANISFCYFLPSTYDTNHWRKISATSCLNGRIESSILAKRQLSRLENLPAKELLEKRHNEKGWLPQNQTFMSKPGSYIQQIITRTAMSVLGQIMDRTFALLQQCIMY